MADWLTGMEGTLVLGNYVYADGPLNLRVATAVDLGCGTVKKGRIGVDRFPAPGVNVVCDLESLETYAVAATAGEDAQPREGQGPLQRGSLPFASGSIRSARLSSGTAVGTTRTRSLPRYQSASTASRFAAFGLPGSASRWTGTLTSMPCRKLPTEGTKIGRRVRPV